MAIVWDSPYVKVVRSACKLVVGAVALLGLSTLAVASTWSIRFDDLTELGWTIERVPSGGLVSTSAYVPTPGMLVVRLSETGAVIWENLLAAPAGSSMSTSRLRASVDGGFCIVNSFALAGESFNAWLAKLDANGRILWQRTSAGGQGYATADDVVATADGGCLLVGGSLTAGPEKLWLMRADAGGTILWSETIDAPGVEGFGRAQELPGGDVVLVAATVGSGSKSNGLVVRLAPNGAIVWQRSLDGPTTLTPQAIAIAPSGDVLVGGEVGNRGQGDGQSGALLVRLDAQGALRDSRVYRGPLQIRSIAIAQDGGFALAGQVFDKDSQFEDGFIIVTDSTGAPVAASTHGGPGQDGLTAIVASGDGGLMVAGFGSESAELGPRLLVEKTDASGALGYACDRITSRAIDLGARPITVRPSSAVLAPFTPIASSLVFSNGAFTPATAQFVCSAP